MADFDVIVIGAGIVGLSHAWAAARAGKRVLVLERSRRAEGASVRNFGMFWPIGQTPGANFQIALRSRERWLEFLTESGLWHDASGSIHLAYADDEYAVMSEFAAEARQMGYQCELLDAAETLRRSPAANPKSLRGGLFSATEVCVDPRLSIAQLPDYLTRKFNVQFRFSTAVASVASGRVETSAADVFHADQIIVCSGTDFLTLFPQTFRDSGIRLCKLQMMSTVPQPNNWRMGPMLASGLTLRHYPTFGFCKSLPAFKDRVARETPEYDRFGVHFLVSQHADGRVILGDSHEYDADITPFDKQLIDDLMLDGLNRLIKIPTMKLAETWHGIYGKHPEFLQYVADPLPGVRIVAGTGGTGMTMSFGLADLMWADWDTAASHRLPASEITIGLEPF